MNSVSSFPRLAPGPRTANARLVLPVATVIAALGGIVGVWLPFQLLGFEWRSWAICFGACGSSAILIIFIGRSKRLRFARPRLRQRLLREVMTPLATLGGAVKRLRYVAKELGLPLLAADAETLSRDIGLVIVNSLRSNLDPNSLADVEIKSLVHRYRFLRRRLFLSRISLTVGLPLTKETALKMSVDRMRARLRSRFAEVLTTAQVRRGEGVDSDA